MKSAREIAITSLRAFPPVDGNHEAAWRYGQRLLSKQLSQRRKQGQHTDTAEERRQREALERELERLAPSMPGPPLLSRARRARPQAPLPAPPDEEELARLVGSAFAVPTDGSPGRARVLARRARDLVKRRVRHSSAGWRQRWRLRRRARALIAREMAAMSR